MGMCHGNIEEYLDKSTAQTIASFISSHTKAIANSVKKQMATASVGVTSENTFMWNCGIAASAVLHLRENGTRAKGSAFWKDSNLISILLLL